MGEPDYDVGELVTVKHCGRGQLVCKVVDEGEPTVYYVLLPAGSIAIAFYVMLEDK